jgi:electron transport complex protein RnfE
MTDRNGLATYLQEEQGFAAVLLGLCPAAAVSVRLIDALWMSAGVVAVLLIASLCMALIARQGGAVAGGQPSAVSPRRWFGALVLSSFLTASFEAVLLLVDPQSSSNLGVYIPLIAVNCLVLARLEAVSNAATVAQTLSRSVRSGLGFAGCLLLVTLVREVLGAGTITLFPVGGFSGTIPIPGLAADPVRALGLAGGGLLCLGYLAAAARMIRRGREAAPVDKEGTV